MRTLLIESQPSCGRSVEARLSTAGHEVVRCFSPGDPLFPCAALDGRCPLDDPAGIDAVVAVRTPTDPDQTISEMGISCALRLDVPVIVTGEGQTDPFGDRVEHVDEDRLLDGYQQVVDRAHEARVAPMRAEARRLVARAGLDASIVDVQLVREGSRTRIAVVLPPGAEEIAEVVAVRMHNLHRPDRIDDRVVDIQLVRQEERS
jgi:hypothetical protein